jgi:hypothetical protein
MGLAIENRVEKVRWNALESRGKCHVCVVIHPVGSQVKLESGLRDAGSEPLLGIQES